MFVSISPDQVYKFDQSIFNHEEFILGTIGIGVAIFAIIATLVGYSSFKKYIEQMNKMLDNMEKKLDAKLNKFKMQLDENIKRTNNELNEFKTQLDKSIKRTNSELIKIKMYSAHMASNSVITLSNNIKTDISTIINALKEFLGEIPDTFEEPSTFVIYLNYFNAITNSVVRIFDKIEKDSSKSEVYDLVSRIDKKLSEKYVKNIGKITDEDDKGRENYHYEIRKNMVNIENQLKNKNN